MWDVWQCNPIPGSAGKPGELGTWQRCRPRSTRPAQPSQLPSAVKAHGAPGCLCRGFGAGSLACSQSLMAGGKGFVLSPSFHPGVRPGAWFALCCCCCAAASCSVSHTFLQLHHTLAFCLLINLSVLASEGSAVSLASLDVCCSRGPQGSSQSWMQRGKSHLWDPEMMYEQFSAATLWETRLTVRCCPS